MILLIAIKFKNNFFFTTKLTKLIGLSILLLIEFVYS